MPEGILVNGVLWELPADRSVEALVLRLGPRGPGVLVAINGEALPKSEWSSRLLAPGDRVELVQAVAGG